MIFCYRLVPLFSHYCKSLSCSTREPLQRPTAQTLYREWETLGYSGLNGTSLIKSLPSQFREPWREESEKNVRPREMEHTKKTRSSKHSRTSAYMNSQRLRHHAQGLYVSASCLRLLNYGFQFSTLMEFLSVFLVIVSFLSFFSSAVLACPTSIW